MSCDTGASSINYARAHSIDLILGDCEIGSAEGIRFGVMGQAYGDFPLVEIAKDCGARGKNT
jgi:hypothetical protein